MQNTATIAEQEDWITTQKSKLIFNSLTEAADLIFETTEKNQRVNFMRMATKDYRDKVYDKVKAEKPKTHSGFFKRSVELLGPLSQF